MMPDLFDFDAKRDRDEALDRVSEPNPHWMRDCLAKIAAAPFGEFTGETLRTWLEKEVGHPHHHNAWGALINTAVRQKTIIFVGRYEHMKGPKSHARKTPVYRKRQVIGALFDD